MDIYTKDMIDYLEFLDIKSMKKYLFINDEKNISKLIKNIKLLNVKLNEHYNKKNISKFIRFINKYKSEIRDNIHKGGKRLLDRNFEDYTRIIRYIECKIETDNENIENIKNGLINFNIEYEETINNIISNFITDNKHEVVKKCYYCNDEELFNIDNFCCIFGRKEEDEEEDEEEDDEEDKEDNYNEDLCCLDCKDKFIENKIIKDGTDICYHKYHIIRKGDDYYYNQKIYIYYYIYFLKECGECKGDYICVDGGYCEICNDDVCLDCLNDCVICDNKTCCKCSLLDENEDYICDNCNE